MEFSVDYHSDLREVGREYKTCGQGQGRPWVPADPREDVATSCSDEGAVVDTGIEERRTETAGGGRTDTGNSPTCTEQLGRHMKSWHWNGVGRRPQAAGSGRQGAQNAVLGVVWGTGHPAWDADCSGNRTELDRSCQELA